MNPLPLAFFVLIFSCSVFCFGKDRVRLKDVSTLTLYKGYMTTGRRSSPVPQLRCVGGTAGCSVQQPSTVQCYNKGSDGYDVQWECKAEMDTRYKFGKTEVVCEGYEYPDDPYILRGSCGLEYTLDYKSSGGGSSYWTGSSSPTVTTKSSGVGGLITLAMIALIIYALYKTCLSSHQYSSTQGDYPDDSWRSSFGGFFGGGRRSAPYPETNYFPGEGCSRQSYGSTGSSGTTRFWQGLMTGGALGYIFGNRNQGSGRTGYHDSASFRDNSSYGSNGSSSSTYTATGYASTRRR